MTDSDSTISIKDVHYIAKLSNIAVTDNEAGKLAAELDTILGYVRQLDSLDTSSVKPTYQVTGLSNVVRDDTIIDYNATRDVLLHNAPRTQDGQIKVPKVL